jgi:methyl-accepting chemotaxis protein
MIQLQRIAAKDFRDPSDTWGTEANADPLTQAFAAAIASARSTIGTLLQYVQQSSQDTSRLPISIDRARSAVCSLQTALIDVNDANALLASAVQKGHEDAAVYATALNEVCAELDGTAPVTEQISTSIKAVAIATDQVSNSVGTVALAVDQMSASLNEVSSNSGKAAGIARSAKEAAQHAANTMDKLGKSAKAIGKVVDMINGIASQTNLLALNATIEAASAGDAGRGFAVVANEVKELAKQTANATDDIRQQVEEMQDATGRAVRAIEDVVNQFAELNTISEVIAAAVEEQTATTRDMANNLGITARGAEEVSSNVHTVSAASSDVSEKVTTAVALVSELTHQFNQLASAPRGTGSYDDGRAKCAALMESQAELTQILDELLGTLRTLDHKGRAVQQDLSSTRI